MEFISLVVLVGVMAHKPFLVITALFFVLIFLDCDSRYCLARIPEIRNNSDLRSSLVPFDVYKEDLEFSTSFSFANNGSMNEASSIQVEEYYDFGSRILLEHSYWDLSLQSRMAYKYYLDSTWQLSEDKLSLSAFRLSQGKARFKYTYSIQINFSTLPSYSYKSKVDDSVFRLRSGGFFDPGDIQIAYGFSIRFWEYSLINFSLATIKIQRSSVYQVPENSADNAYYKPLWNIDYGFSMNTRISHQFNKRIRWDNQSRLFLNSIDKKTIRLNINNQIRYKLNKHLVFSALTQLNYTPRIVDKVELSQEFRLGVYWSLCPKMDE